MTGRFVMATEVETPVTLAETFDPARFVADVIAARGGIVENGIGLLPPELATELDLPQEIALASNSIAGLEGGLETPSTVSCALGSMLLEKLVAWARSSARYATARLSCDPPRVSAGSSLASRFVVRNALAEVERAFATETAYAVLYVAWAAEADDRQAGVVRLVANVSDGSVPCEQFADLVCARAPRAELAPSNEANELAIDAAASRALAALARRAVLPRAESLVRAAARRHARDHGRVAAYFDALASEARSPRGRQAAGAIEARLAHLDAEREAKLHELEARYAVRVSFEPAALVIVTAPVVEVRLRVRRRKASGELALRLPPGAQALDEIACAACAAPTSRPVVCDERLHALCEACVPSAQGRPDCAACRARG